MMFRNRLVDAEGRGHRWARRRTGVHFAWWPVKLRYGVGTAWLEHVYRKATYLPGYDSYHVAHFALGTYVER